MHAVDTNVVVRYLMNDDETQAARVRRFVDATSVLLPLSVVLETEWVLRSVYRLTPADIGAAIRKFIGLPTVSVEQLHRVLAALAWFERGMDFGDALHLSAAENCDGFATFDRAFIKTAARLGAGSVAEP